MTKLYFLFILCALTRADHQVNQYSGVGANDASGLRQSASQGYTGSSTNAQNSDSSSGYGGANDQSSYSRQSGTIQASGSYGSNSNLNQASSYRTVSASSGPGASDTSGYSGTSTYTGTSSGSDLDRSINYSGSTSKQASDGYSQTQTYTGSSHQQEVGNDKDHNGLSLNDVHQLAAEGNRRRLQSKYYGYPKLARTAAPKRYGSLSPPRYLSHRPVYGRSGEADSNVASNYGTSGSKTGSSYDVGQNQKEYSSHNAGSSYSSNDNHNREEEYSGSSNQGYGGSLKQGYSGSSDQGYSGSSDQGYSGSSNQRYSGSSKQAGQSAAISGYGNNDASAQEYRGANSGYSASDQLTNQGGGQEAQDSRRFLLQNGYDSNPFQISPFNNLDTFNDFNSESYLKAALGPFGKK